MEIKGAGLTGIISENKNECLRFLRVIESFGQKSNFSGWEVNATLVNLVRIKRHNHRPIKMYWRKKAQLA